MATDDDAARPMLWLVGFRLDPDSDGEPDLFTVLVNDDRPLVCDRSLVMFGDPSLANDALARDDDTRVRQSGPVSEEPEYVYDVASALSLMSSADLDTTGTIVQVLNVLFDLVAASGFEWPPEDKKLLYAFADHLTFDQEFGSFLAEESGRREQAIDAVLWGIGVVATHTTVLRVGREA